LHNAGASDSLILEGITRFNCRYNNSEVGFHVNMLRDAANLGRVAGLADKEEGYVSVTELAGLLAILAKRDECVKRLTAAVQLLRADSGVAGTTAVSHFRIIMWRRRCARMMHGMPRSRPLRPRPPARLSARARTRLLRCARRSLR
jgi:hypothetical protein